MTIKFNRPTANQYLSAPDSTALTFPNGDWAIGLTVVFDGALINGDGAAEYLISTGAFTSGGSFNLWYVPANGTQNVGKLHLSLDTDSNTVTPALLSAATFTSGAYQFVIQRSGTTLSMRYTPILTSLPSDGSSVTTGATGSRSGALDGAVGLIIGVRADLVSARFFNQSMGRVFRYDGTLTDLEVAKLAYGMEITDLGKTPAWYIRMDTASDTADRGSQANTITPHGALATGTSPGFGYTGGTPTAPTITGAPTTGTAQVGSAVSVTPATASGSPTPTNSYQWKIDGVAISGATGTSYTPVSGDATKTLTVTQTASNTQGAATATSAGVVVSAATSTVDVTQITAERIFQRIGTAAPVAMSGTYTSTTPTSIEYQLYAADGTTILQAWAAIAGATINGGTWTGTPSVPQGGMYRLAIRSKSGATVLATSSVKSNLFGVGDLIACIGSSSAEKWFDSNSGTGFTPAANVRRHQAGIWSTFASDGCAIQMANSFATQAGVPIGMLGYGIGGDTLANWLNTSSTSWTTFANAVSAVGGKLAGVMSSMGSNDAANGLVTSRASHLANLRQLAVNCRNITSTSTLKILVSGFNRRPAVATTPADQVRMAECDFGDDTNVYHVQTIDFELSGDSIHLTQAGFTACGVRTSAVFGAVMNGGAYIRGPKITGISYTPATVKISLAHRNGTDFTPTSGITGFSATDDSGALSFSSLARSSATEITATPSRTIVGRPTVTYLSGSAPTSNVMDNGVLPLPMMVETSLVAASSADTTAPVMTGSIVSSAITTTGFTLTWQSATDAVGVTGYEVSIDNGNTYDSAGNALTVTKSGLSSATLYNTKVRAFDAAGNRATPLSLAVTTATAADVTAPTMNGSITVGAQSTSGFTLSWAAASDNVGVTGYKVSTDNGVSYTDVGNVLTSTRSGLSAATTYNVRVYAYDAAGNAATPLTATATTTSAADTTAPVMTGTINVTGLNSGGFTFNYPAATDNVTVIGYEASVDTGVASYSSVGNTLVVAKTGLVSSTLYNIRVRSFDAAGNRSNVLTTTATTLQGQALATSLTLTFKDRSGTVKAGLTGMKWAFFDQTTPDAFGAPTAKGTGATTNSGGILALNITGTQLVPGATGWLVFSNSDGTATQTNLISFAGPCVVA